MDLRLFDYDLPPELIAQEPAARRDASRLLELARGGSMRGHFHFADLPDLLAPGDLLILNDTRVLPARLLGCREQTGGRWEGLFLSEHPGPEWHLLCQTRGRLLEGETVLVESPPVANAPGSPESAEPGPPLRLTFLGRSAAGHPRFRPETPGTVLDLLGRYGRVPLPPYIRKGRAAEADRERYQTIFARPPGSVAAPTAGLHFTPELFERLAQRGISRAFVTLHVGAGTFLPVESDDVTQHCVLPEWCEVPEATVAAVTACRARAGRVIAVGTTTTRTLESAARDGVLRPWSGSTDLTIRPPFTFHVLDGLITNFHLPRSSLLLLVAAFTGLASMQEAYRSAVAERYRFYSYGDAMLIL
jgi:S-adenosylmethionine:tRNA ribosyltransferase-isomerase